MIWLIVPVYNTEDYLEETLDSIINQTIWDKGNISIHLVDDASSDNSLQICNEYQTKYKDRIKVTHLEENHGVAYARNFALNEHKHEKDVIIGFIDSDDKLKNDSIEKMLAFFDTHQDVNIAVMELYFFDAVEKPHRTNWRFENKEVVDIRKDYMYYIYYIGGAFFRNSALNELVFDEEMKLWEDALAIYNVLLSENKYGLVSGAVYYYRKRQDQSSQVDRAWYTKDRYFPFLENAYMKLINMSRKKKHKIIPWVQVVIAYHIRLYVVPQFHVAVQSFLSKKEQKRFKEEMRKILRYIAPKYIVRLQTSLVVIEELLSIREGKRVRIPRTYENGDCYFKKGDYVIGRMSERSIRIFGELTEEEDPRYVGWLRGRFNTPIYQMKKDDYVFIEHGDVQIRANRYKCLKRIDIFDDNLRNFRNAGFVVKVPEEWGDDYRFGINMEAHDIYIDNIVYLPLNLDNDDDDDTDDKDGD